VERLSTELDYRVTYAREFQTALRHSGQSSVDAFLEYRPEYLEIGKCLFAWRLMMNESTDNLFADESKSWYHYLFQAMRAPFDRFRLNRRMSL
jgi:hypothetical protein